jgi:hypothetical protein
VPEHVGWALNPPGVGPCSFDHAGKPGRGAPLFEVKTNGASEPDGAEAVAGRAIRPRTGCLAGEIHD